MILINFDQILDFAVRNLCLHHFLVDKSHHVKLVDLSELTSLSANSRKLNYIVSSGIEGMAIY